MIKVPADSVSGKGLLLASQRAIFCVPHGGGGDGALWGPFYKCISPIHEGSTLIPNHLSKASPDTIPLGIRFKHVNFGGMCLVLQHALPHLILQRELREEGLIISPILQMRKLRPFGSPVSLLS